MIYLINMPFSSVIYPALGLPVVGGILKKNSIPYKSFYFNFDFMKQIGLYTYESIAFFKGIRTQVSEWFFKKEAWNLSFDEDTDEFLEYCIKELPTLPVAGDKKKWLLFVRDIVVPNFLNECLDHLNITDETKVIGFSCGFFQTLPSIALGRKIKEKYPHVKIIFGGACFHGTIGEELFEKIEWIDAVSISESDDTIVECFQKLSNGEALTNLQGIYYRDKDRSIVKQSGECVSQEIFDNSILPDFDGFFEGLERSGIQDVSKLKKKIVLPFESSRGCWWGEKHQCSFCGVNGVSIPYRLKDAKHVYKTLKELYHKYNIRRFHACDNNLSMNYFDTLIPQMIQNPPVPNAQIHYCVKPNMKRTHIKALKDSGIISTQPGIENLSDHLLKLMNKGISSMHNIYYLKCARQYGVVPHWNMLIQIPGEKKEDYDELSALIPDLVHFNPPGYGCPKVEFHKYSIYDQQREKWCNKVEPQYWYGYLYPKDKFDLDKIAYYFNAEWKDTLPEECYHDLEEQVEKWRFMWKSMDSEPMLYYEIKEGLVYITDTRFQSKRILELSESESLVYLLLDDMVNLSLLENELNDRVSKEQIIEHLNTFKEEHLIISMDNKILGLALPEDFARWSYNERRKMFKY